MPSSLSKLPLLLGRRMHSGWLGNSLGSVAVWTADRSFTVALQKEKPD